MTKMLDVPVVMIVFRRPEHTRRVLSAIRGARPRRLLVIADGASAERPGEGEKCAAARAVVDEMVDWPCEVLKNYSEVNLGVEGRFYSGFQWVFAQCESAIILEDDEVPHESFFGFCQEMLERYREDERVFAVNGANFIADRYSCAESYYFSRYFHCWGFATWRRAWSQYDLRVSRWREVRGTNWLLKLCDGRGDEAAHHAENFERVHRGEIRTWDYQITFAMWLRGALAITPSVNLVSNIGFGGDSLHYKDADHPFANMGTGAVARPLRHPVELARDAGADREEYRAVIEPWLRIQERRRRPSFGQRLRRLMGR
jgi:hypothetical protein